MKAKYREDLADEFEGFVGIDYGSGNEVQVETDGTDSYECSQPDILDDEEFNLLIKVNNKVLKVMSIDFDFYG